MVICFHWGVLQLSSHFFLDLLDSIIVDVASECHRVARLGLDSNLEEEDEELKLSAQARVRVADPSNSNEANGKYVVDIFGQTHPPVANEIFDCLNCGRSIMAGRFAPHLEKCMGKVVLLTSRIVYLLIKYLLIMPVTLVTIIKSQRVLATYFVTHSF